MGNLKSFRQQGVNPFLVQGKRVRVLGACGCWHVHASIPYASFWSVRSKGGAVGRTLILEQDDLNSNLWASHKPSLLWSKTFGLQGPEIHLG